VEALLAALTDVFNGQLPQVNRALIRFVESVQREYMWDYVSAHWDDLRPGNDGLAMAYLLARRLAASLSGTAVTRLAADLGGDPEHVLDPTHRHPVQYYIAPPVSRDPQAGEILTRMAGEVKIYRILLTPSCDIAQKKADFVLLAECEPLSSVREYKKWQGQQPPSNTALGELTAVLTNNRKPVRERSYFLPGAVGLPNLVVDLQKVGSIPLAELESFERVAALDSPFAEALLSQFARYFGRIGTPDLDSAAVIAQLR
jgi:hypothetical protein